MPSRLNGVDLATHLLEVQWEVSRHINSEAEPPIVLDRVLDLLMQLPDISGLWVWFLEAGDTRPRLAYQRGLAAEVADCLGQHPAASPLLDQLRMGNEVLLDWKSIWGVEAAVFKEQGIREVLTWPFCVDGKPVGALGVLGKTSEGWPEPLLVLLRTVTVQLGGMVGRARVEAELRNHRFNMAQLFNAVEDQIFIVSQSGTILHCNEAWSGLDHPSGNDMKGRPIQDYLPSLGSLNPLSGGPDEEAGLLPSRQARILLGDGSLLPVEIRAFRGRWDEEPVCYLICRNQSEIFNMERDRELLTTAIEQSDDSILITNSAGTIQYTNSAFSSCYGYTAEEVRGANPRLLKSGVHGREFYHGMWATLNRGEVWSGRMVNRKKNGEHFTEFATISPVRDKNGIITHFVALKRDMTKEVVLEERLRQSQKMEAIGTLAGGLAHDFNNILYALLGYCQLAMEDAPREGPVLPYLEEIQKAGNRASSLVAKMLTLGCRNESEKIVMDLRPVIQEALDLVRASLPTTITFDVDLQKSDFGVRADPTQIHQVVLNLATNAEYAMRERGGILKVRLEEVDLTSAEASLWHSLSPGKHLRLIVADTGTGMDQVTVDRIFEPYFTTKDTDEGRGLGMATVQGIIINHEGRIYVKSKEGVGSTFTIFLPVTQDTEMAEEVQGLDEGDKAIDGTGRIYVVDDEKMIVDVQSKALSKLGYTVTGFTDGLKALAAFEKDPLGVDLVITDQTMPHLTGFELATHLLRCRPELPIIMTTGYSEQLQDVDLAEAGIRQLLPKPIRISQLAEAVSSTLAREHSTLEV